MCGIRLDPLKCIAGWKGDQSYHFCKTVFRVVFVNFVFLDLHANNVESLACQKCSICWVLYALMGLGPLKCIAGGRGDLFYHFCFKTVLVICCICILMLSSHIFKS